MKKTGAPRSLPLFAARTERVPLDFDSRLREFARAAASRGRGSPGDVERFVAALRGYHRAWTICSRETVPHLDERAIRIAVSAYVTATSARRRPAA